MPKSGLGNQGCPKKTNLEISSSFRTDVREICKVFFELLAAV